MEQCQKSDLPTLQYSITASSVGALARYDRGAAVLPGPGLEWAAARGEWRVGISDLRDMAETAVLQVFHQRALLHPRPQSGRGQG